MCGGLKIVVVQQRDSAASAFGLRSFSLALFLGKGGGGDEDFVTEAQAEPAGKGEAGPSVV